MMFKVEKKKNENDKNLIIECEEEGEKDKK